MVSLSCFDDLEFDDRSGEGNQGVPLPCCQNSKSLSTIERFFHQGLSLYFRYRGRFAAEMVLLSKSYKCSRRGCS